MYNHDLLDITYDYAEHRYVVWYDGVFLGLTKTYGDAHYLVINYVVS